MGNPEIRLVVPSAEVSDVRPMGEEERHARFSLRSGTARVGGVAFGVGGTLERAAPLGPYDASVRLELNQWNGAVEPRVLLGSLYERASRPVEDVWRCEDDEFLARLAAALEGPMLLPGRSVGRPDERPALSASAGLAGRSLEEARQVVDRRASSGLAAIAELASNGEAVLVVCADALWRRAIVEGAAHPGRFGSGSGAVVAARGSISRGVAAAERIAASGEGGMVVADWAALSLEPGLGGRFSHVVVADPAPSPALQALVTTTQKGGGYLHLLASRNELSLRWIASAFPERGDLATAFRALRETGGLTEGAALRRALCGPSGLSRSPESGALALRILAEVGVVRTAPSGPTTLVEVVSSGKGDLASSVSFRSIRKAHEECVRYLSQPEKPSSNPLQAAA